MLFPQKLIKKGKKSKTQQVTVTHQLCKHAITDGGLFEEITVLSSPLYLEF
jgi:hypothetical protein